KAKARSTPLTAARAVCCSRIMKASSVLWRQEQGKYRGGQKRLPRNSGTVHAVGNNRGSARESRKIWIFFARHVISITLRMGEGTASFFSRREGKSGRAGAVLRDPRGTTRHVTKRGEKGVPGPSKGMAAGALSRPSPATTKSGGEAPGNQ